MSPAEAAVLLSGSVVVLLLLGVPIAFAFLTTNVLGAVVFMGGTSGVRQLIGNATESVTTFALVPIPLFLLMGELFYHTGLAARVFDALDKCLGGMRGRLAYLTVFGGTIFAALSGSSMANTAMMGSMIVPEMSRRGYKKSITMGPIMGTGGLAVLIPPSSLTVLLGTIASIDIGGLLIAGIVPGLVLATFYALTIYLQTRLDPAAAPGYAVASASLREKAAAVLRNIAPMGLVIFCVIGLMVLGVATPTEAAAFGVLGVIVLAGALRTLGWQALRDSIAGTMRITGMTFLILLGSSVFSQLLAFSGASAWMIGELTGLELTRLGMLLAMFGILILLGMFMDPLSMMLLTLPVFLPIAQSLAFDPIWFGIIVLLSLEISFTTPPFGMLLFVMLGVAPQGTTMTEVVLAALPYIFCAIMTVAMIIAFPAIATWLPAVMR
jgi:tripartite ATP-independent transporter DctM subunit